MSTSSTYILAGLSLLVVTGITIYRRIRFSIKHIRGPPCSFWRGNMRDFFYQPDVGMMDSQYTEDYGLVWRMGAPFGQDVLLVADPKALQHIFQKAGYTYEVNTEKLITRNLLIGPSILSARSGHDHSRHRKVMNPAFSTPQLRTFLPSFRRIAGKMCDLLREEVSQGAHPDGQLIAVNKLLSRTTLDIIGESGFRYDLGALDNSHNELCEAYENMFVKSRINPTIFDSIFRATWRFFPLWFVDYVKYLPKREYTRLRATREVADRISGNLVDQAIEDARSVGFEKSKKDMISVLVRANVSENPSSQLSKKEIMAQIGALILAGHETTANTLTWMLWELARHPKFQDTLRAEIRDKRREIDLRDTVDANGNSDFTLEDLESMPFLQAIVKETLRFQPTLYHLTRSATKDDVIPLSEPISTVNGNVVDHIAIAKGQMIVASTCAYNRIKKIWGEDANEFNPMRFINDSTEHEAKVGMYNNLMSFSAGLRGCIGWRFALIEMQATIVALVEQFEFSVPSKEHKIEIVRKPLGFMTPMVKDRLHEGALMPLMVKVL